jgi:hypothetical protein
MSAHSKADLARMLDKVGAGWRKAKRQADKEQRLSARQISRVYYRRDYDYLTEIVDRVMAEAYALVSDNGRLPAHARQLMYAVRDMVLKERGRAWANDSYFTQNLLPKYEREHPDRVANWDVVYDDRGHFIEPHTGKIVGLGTLAAREYIGSWHADIRRDPELLDLDTDYPTSGPANRYCFVLFIEKEGFMPLMEAAGVAERFDLAIMSTKGMSVIAARRLVEHLTVKGCTILVAHDFDISGLCIAHTLGHDTGRYRFKVEPRLIDIGLRLDDIVEMGLTSEPVEYKNANVKKYEEYGATQDELRFLLGVSLPDNVDGRNGAGRRVELNAMTSRQFIEWLERKLAENGVQKVVPDRQTLGAAWRRARAFIQLEKAAKQIRQRDPEMRQTI